MNNRRTAAVTMVTLLLYMGAATATAQEDRHVELEGITVKAARTINKTDGQIIFPTREQKESSSSAYSILQKIALPELRIDETSRSITSVSNRGEVQMRINGIKADADELTRLDCTMVERIEYTDRPGVRYGEDIGYVINIITRRPDSGYSTGVRLTEAVTAEHGNNSAFYKINRGKSQWEMSYTFSHNGGNGSLQSSTANYLMPDNSVRSITRHDTGSSIRINGHDIQMIYNRMDSSRYTFQAKLCTRFSRTPYDRTTRLFTDLGIQSVTELCSSDRTVSPAADIYYNLKTGQNQSLTINAQLSQISSNYKYSDTEGSTYSYDVDGKSWSLVSEAIYENQLKPFNLSAGIQYRYKHIDNIYTGDASAHDRSHTHSVYTFGEIKGTLQKLGYTAGIGMSRLSFTYSDNGYNFWLFRPKLQLSHPVIRNIRLSYDFEISQHVSGIANTSNASIRINSMETERGNPDLQPNRVTEHSLRLSYSAPRLQAHALLYAKLNDNCNMSKYIRETDTDGKTTFIRTQSNQKGVDLIMTQGYLNYYIIPEKLCLSATGSIFRCINHGNDYSHYYTAFNGSASLTAYLGRLTLSAYADNGFRWMEGETRGHQGGYNVISATYSHKNISVSLRWQNPLIHEEKSLKTELLNKYINKTCAYTSRDMANLVSISLSWQLSHGRKYKSIKRNAANSDTDTGIMKGGSSHTNP